MGAVIFYWNVLISKSFSWLPNCRTPNSKSAVDNSIMVLEEARWELLAQDCATDAGTGHSKEAEQLKEEIDKMLKQLYQQQENSGGGDGSESGEQGKEKPEELDAKEQSVREEISKMQEKAYQEREAERQFMQEIDLETVFDYEGDIW